MRMLWLIGLPLIGVLMMLAAILAPFVASQPNAVDWWISGWVAGSLFMLAVWWRLI